jgi:methyl coenzyme M reductase subunit D
MDCWMIHTVFRIVIKGTGIPDRYTGIPDRSGGTWH